MGKTFEELIVWQDARKLCQDLYPFIIREKYNSFQKLKNQIIGSAESIPDNIAEGFERGSNKEFIQFLYFAKGSCGELRSQIYRSYDYEIITNDEHLILLDKCKRLSAKIANFIKSMYQSDYKGPKNKLNENY